MHSSTNEFGEGVEKRADWLLKDIRQMSKSTTNMGNGTGLLRASSTTAKQTNRTQLENVARGETALITIQPSSASSDLRYEMSRRYNKARRADAGWVDDDADFSSDATTPYGGSGGDDYNTSPTSPTSPTSASSSSAALSAASGGFAGVDDRGLMQSMRIDPDPGGFREKYLQTFDGLQGYSKEGITNLDLLVQEAVRALENSKVPSKEGHCFGASLMTKSGNVYTACNVESSVDSLVSSAERTCVLKAATEGHVEFLGLVIASDAHEVDSILPDGTSRQFLAEFGNFDVYVVTSDGKRHQYMTYDLFPSAGRRTPASPMKTRVQKRTVDTKGGSRGQRGQVRGGNALSEVVGTSEPTLGAAREWSVRDVVTWVEENLELPTLGANFARNAIDGALLLHLTERDLEDMLNVRLPMHRRKLLMGIHKLRGESAEGGGIGGLGSVVENIGDYLALLDEERVKTITRLKASFDSMDKNGDGALGPEEVKSAFTQLGMDDSSEAVFRWMRTRDQNGDGKVSFEEFVLAYTTIFAEIDGEMVSKKEKINKHLNGHVSTRRRGNGRESSESGSSAQSWRGDDPDVNRNEDRAGEDDLEGGALSPLGIDTLSGLKRAFDVVDSDKDGKLNHGEACRAFAQLNIRVSREGVKEYLLTNPPTARGVVTFKDFYKAFVAFIDNTFVREREVKLERSKKKAARRASARLRERRRSPVRGSRYSPERSPRRGRTM